jgi:hypothetical protein
MAIAAHGVAERQHRQCTAVTVATGCDRRHRDSGCWARGWWARGWLRKVKFNACCVGGQHCLMRLSWRHASVPAVHRRPPPASGGCAAPYSTRVGVTTASNKTSCSPVGTAGTTCSSRHSPCRGGGALRARRDRHAIHQGRQAATGHVRHGPRAWAGATCSARTTRNGIGRWATSYVARRRVKNESEVSAAARGDGRQTSTTMDVG